jgi:transcription elongation factor Elf1
MQSGGDAQLVEPDGFLLECPHCRQELRVAKKYAGANVECKLCRGHFHLDPNHPSTRLRGFFAECPHCLEELRAHSRFRLARVACKLCGGRIQFVAAPSRRSPTMSPN